MSSLLAIAMFLLAVGLALAVLEVFLPSGGLLSLMSALALVSGVVCAWNESPAWGWGTLIATVLLVPVIVVTGFRVLPNTAVGRRMILTRRELDDTRAADAGAIDPRPDPDPLIEGESVEIGMIGQAGTDLRPTGTGRFGRQRVSVVTEGEWIDHDTAIRVVRVEGNRIVVEAAT